MYIFCPRVVKSILFAAVTSFMYVSPENSALTEPVLEIIAPTFVSFFVPSALSRPFILTSFIANTSTL